MIATIDGHIVQGTPEEIGRLLGFTIKSSNSNYATTTYIPSGNCPPGYDPNLCGDTDCRKCVEQWMKEEDICINCPHQGEGCNPQFCL